MPKITVQVARQRYERVPKIDEATGEAIQILVNRQRRRSDQPIYKKVMINDKNRPLPPRKCERCQDELTVGEKYQSIGIKTQGGGYVRYRCMKCPRWQPHEYSNALWARIAQIQAEDIDGSQWTEESDATSRAEEIAGMIRELAEEKRESATNIEDGFGHAVPASEELNEQADNLDGWADDIENISFDDFPEGKCSNCGGEQLDCSTHEEHSDDPDAENYCDGSEECMECNDSGEGDDVDEQELAEWQENAAQAIRDALDNSPL